MDPITIFANSVPGAARQNVIVLTSIPDELPHPRDLSSLSEIDPRLVPDLALADELRYNDKPRMCLFSDVCNTGRLYVMSQAVPAAHDWRVQLTLCGEPKKHVVQTAQSSAPQLNLKQVKEDAASVLVRALSRALHPVYNYTADRKYIMYDFHAKGDLEGKDFTLVVRHHLRI